MRAVNPLFGSANIAFARPPPCMPVAPRIAMIFVSAMIVS
jgi:hypothetical protein